MKIEKVNDNQIRCTLTKEDLACRSLKISELAYGTQKAKDLFRDMMQQAAINENNKGDNASKAVNVKDYEILQKHLTSAFGVPVKFTCDQSGKGKITFPFTTEEQLEKIIRIFDNLKEA